MKYKVKLGKYINFSLISNCIIFNTLAGCSGKSDEKQGYSGKKKIVQIDSPEELAKNKKEEEERKKQEQEAKEEQEKRDKKTQFQKNRNILIQDFNSLSADFNKLNSVSTKMFDINLFKISLIKTKVEGCAENTIDNIAGRLNNEKEKFNTNLKVQFGVLKNKYTEFNNENNKRNNDTKVSFDGANIEAIIKKTGITVDEFITLNNELVGYSELLRNGLDGYKNKLINDYKDEKYKNKFAVAKAIDNTFNYDFESDYNKIETLAELGWLQNINKNIVEKNTKADKIIENKKNTLTNDINVKLNEYNVIFTNLSLEKMGIEKKDFSALNSIDISTVANFNNISNKLNELSNELNIIKTDFKTFFLEKFKNKLEAAQGCEIIDLLETYLGVFKNKTLKQNVSKSNVLPI